jgi:hypothetical protein
VDDAVFNVAHRDVANAEARAVLLEAGNLPSGQALRKRQVPKACRHRVVGHRDMSVGTTKRTMLVDEARECLRARDLLHEVPVDIQKGAAAACTTASSPLNINPKKRPALH